MPNWVRNTIVFKEPKDLFEKMKSKDSDFDFNKLIPMPKDLDITCPTGWYEGDSWNKPSELDTILKPMFDMIYNEDISQKDFIELAKKAIAKNCLDEQFNKNYGSVKDRVLQGYFNYHRYGWQDWYSWHCDNWGTKWNVYKASVNGNTIMFDTAWSTPHKILEKLAEDFDFVCTYADEDIGSNFGVFVAENGKLREEPNMLLGESPTLFAAMCHYCDTELDDVFVDDYTYTDKEYDCALKLYDYYLNYYSRK